MLLTEISISALSVNKHRHTAKALGNNYIFLLVADKNHFRRRYAEMLRNIRQAFWIGLSVSAGKRGNVHIKIGHKLGRKCIDWGVDLVIGHHPHVLQGIEEYKGRYIIYSLANFCFGANRNPEDKDTMIFQQTFTFENGEKVEDQNARIIPCMVSSVKTRNDFRPTPATGEDKQRILKRMNEYSSAFCVAFDEDGGIIVN